MTLEDITPEDAFLKRYVRLRTIIDGLETTALRYCLQEKDPAERDKRAQALEGILMPAVKEVAKLSGIGPELSGACGDGYCLCDGVCVPYNCPETGGNN